jgi:hypothetical protein
MPSLYQPGIPTGTVDLDVDYLNLQNNFSQANTTMGVNHYPFDDGTVNNGKHKFVGMPVTTTPATAVNEGALYFKTIASGTALFMVRDNNLGTDVQLTTASVGNVNSSSRGYTWLPGGLFMQWGTVASPGSSGSVTFSAGGGVAFTSIYNIQLAARNDGSHSAFSYWIDGAPTATGFSYRGSTSGSQTLYWVAIGSKP